jgi:hypothetical protein
MSGASRTQKLAASSPLRSNEFSLWSESASAAAACQAHDCSSMIQHLFFFFSLAKWRYWRRAWSRSPAGCFYKKLLDLSFPFAKISFKRNLNAVEKAYSCYNMSYFARKWKKMILSAEKTDTVDREWHSAEPRR